MVPTLHKILTGSTAAKDHARRLLGFGSHELNQALIRFAEEVQQAEDALIHSIETPSLTEIFNAVDCATGWAEKFGKLHDQTEAARKFSHDLKQVSLELQTACQMDRSFQQTRRAFRLTRICTMFFRGSHRPAHMPGLFLSDSRIMQCH